MIAVRTPSLMTNTLPLPDVSLIRISLPGPSIMNRGRMPAKSMNSSTTNPGGAVSAAPSGFGTTVGVVAHRRRGKRRRQVLPVHRFPAALCRDGDAKAETVMMAIASAVSSWTRIIRAMKTRLLTAVAILGLSARVGGDAAWKWTGSYGDKAVEMLIIGDIQVHSRRADPTTAFNRMRDTLKKADLVYANLEGLLVKSVGTTIDIPDKPEWTHPGPTASRRSRPSNIAVVGVANNVASGRANILKSLGVLDANGIIHTGAGRNIDEAHKPAIVERKGVKIGFLQYTARWYQDKDMIATATEAGVAKITSLDGITIDPGDLERAARPTSRSSGRWSTSWSSRITTATARRRCSSARSRARARAAIGRRPRSTRSSSRTSRSTPAPTSSSATARTRSRASRSTTASRSCTRSATRISISPATRSPPTASPRAS